MQKYRFVVDCIDKKSCKTIRADMTKKDFKVHDKTVAWEGDHYGIKEFSSKKAAGLEAKKK